MTQDTDVDPKVAQTLEFLNAAQNVSSRIFNFPDNVWMLFEGHLKNCRGKHQPEVFEDMVLTFIFSLNNPFPELRYDNAVPITTADIQAHYLPDEFIERSIDLTTLWLKPKIANHRAIKSMSLYDVFHYQHRFNRFMSKKGRPTKHLRSHLRQMNEREEETNTIMSDFNDPKPSKKLIHVTNAIQVYIQLLAEKLNMSQNEIYGIAVLSYCLRYAYLDPLNPVRDEALKNDLFPPPMNETVHHAMSNQRNLSRGKTGVAKWYGLPPTSSPMQAGQLEKTDAEAYPDLQDIQTVSILSEEQLQQLERLSEQRRAMIEKELEEIKPDPIPQAPIVEADELFHLLDIPAVVSEPPAEEFQVGYNTVNITPSFPSPIPDAHKPQDHGGVLFDEDDELFNL